MLLDCRFNGQPCSVDDFVDFRWIQGDKCYTFNSGKSKLRILSATGPGVQKGLSLTINIEHFDYYRDKMDAGVHLILHGQQETPIRLVGSMLPPGYTTYVKVVKKKMLNLKKPYRTNCGSVPLKHFKVYSKHTCWFDQLVKYVEKHCGCKDPFMPGDIDICNFTMAKSCLWPKWEIYADEKLYTCPSPCEIDSYSHSISRSLFPSQTYSKHLGKELKALSHQNKSTQQFIRDNILRVIVYYDDLSFELLEQLPSYDTLEWLGDIGGQIGLFVGAGVLSYFELLDCLILVVYTYLFSGKKELHEIKATLKKKQNDTF